MLCCADGSLYTGIAVDIDARIARHNRGEGAKYTRSRRPVQLVYTEQVADRGQALRREYELKQYDRRDKLALIGTTRPEQAFQENQRGGVKHATS
jgi:putative endonuclease